MGNQNENNEYPVNRGSKRYVVYVDDNFHHKDESERYKLGEFSSCEKPLRRAIRLSTNSSTVHSMRTSPMRSSTVDILCSEKILSSSQRIEIDSSRHGIMRKNVAGNW